MADEALRSIQPKLDQEPAPNAASPTASTLMFRNMPLLGQLLAAIAWIVDRKGNARIHVGACSSGEEVYSLALGEKRHDLMIANNVLVHLPLSGKQDMLRRLVGRLESDGLLCIGGGRQDDLAPVISELGLVAVERGSAAVFDAWSIQRRAWYSSPRPYWALPPARCSAGEPWRHATLFARSRASAEVLEELIDADRS